MIRGPSCNAPSREKDLSQKTSIDLSTSPTTKATPDEARLALRLLLRHLNELPAGTVFAPHDLDGWLRRARARAKVTTTAEGAVGTGEWVGLSSVDVRGFGPSSDSCIRDVEVGLPRPLTVGEDE